MSADVLGNSNADLMNHKETGLVYLVHYSWLIVTEKLGNVGLWMKQAWVDGRIFCTSCVNSHKTLQSLNFFSSNFDASHIVVVFPESQIHRYALLI